MQTPCVRLRNELNLRVSDALLDWLDKQAADAKLPRSTYARRLIEQEAMRDLPRQEEPGDAAV